MILRFTKLAAAAGIAAGLFAASAATSAPLAIPSPAAPAADNAALDVQYRGSGTIYYYYDWQPGPPRYQPRNPPRHYNHYPDRGRSYREPDRRYGYNQGYENGPRRGYYDERRRGRDGNLYPRRPSYRW
jgi:hypothetical protein